jgi:hypothetical protein
MTPLCVLQLHLYGILPRGPYTVHWARERWRTADALLPPGTHLAVVEPFFKAMVDGTWGVRVDDPGQVSGGGGRERGAPRGGGEEQGMEHYMLWCWGQVAYKAGMRMLTQHT